MFKYDIHVHTKESSDCGKVKGRKVAKIHKDAGYSGIVITDHFHYRVFDGMKTNIWEKKVEKYLKGFYESEKAGKEFNLKVLMGMEIRFAENYNDYLVYGIDKEFLLSNENMPYMNLEEFYNYSKVYDENILIIQAHPFRQAMNRAPIKYLDGIEVYNGNPRHDSNNILASEWGRQNGVILTSGSDFHHKEDIGSGGIITNKIIENEKILVKILTENDFELIRNINKIYGGADEL